MKVIETVKDLRHLVKDWKQQGLSVGFVPTMGFLHAGHQSLIKEAAKYNDKVVVSIFVNPMQFGPSEDLEKYPRDLNRDKQACKDAGAHVIFHPKNEEIYSPGFSSCVEVNGVSEELCGKSRPGHFRGVATVVCKLFNIVGAEKAYFGQKDAQQLAVIRRMVKDLNIDIEVIGCPIVREADGLAMSSRNSYLNTEQRAAALCLYKAVQLGGQMLEDGVREAAVIKNALTAFIEKEPLAKIDYIEFVDADTIKPVQQIDRPVICALAVFIGKTRLIDNFYFVQRN
ncbi:pantoate--beta-alanine ligase [Elusimicrobium posterum]|uniref:pantoate--beta-alanine ligase n=1 Tax=Elusimicrobium posterum TaxID=3116653 RepID=UPI003C7343B9